MYKPRHRPTSGFIGGAISQRVMSPSCGARTAPVLSARSSRSILRMRCARQTLVGALHEKGGKRHEMPCHHNLEAYLDAYLQAAGILEAKKSPLFRSARGRTDELTTSPMSRIDVWRMIRRRAKDARLSADICCHTFRTTGIAAPISTMAARWRMLS
jgi:integrase